MNNTTISYVGEASLERVLTLLKTKIDSITLTPITSQEITNLFDSSSNN